MTNVIVTTLRREFVRRENNRLGEFLGADDVVGWRRSYKCECGYTCTAPGDIYDHAQACKMDTP